MARGIVTLTQLSRTPVSFNFGDAAVADGMAVDNSSGRVYVKVTNDSASAITVSFPIAAKVDGCSVSPKTVTVAAGQTKLFGPFPKHLYNQTGDLLYVDLSATTNVKVGAFVPASLEH